jgi:hypothetical protein
LNVAAADGDEGEALVIRSVIGREVCLSEVILVAARMRVRVPIEEGKLGLC